MLELGVLVAAGLIVTFAKLPWKWRLWMLSHPVFMDILIFAALTLVHWGTFSGVMVAGIGAMFCSLTLSAGRWAFGHVEDGTYIRGHFDIAHKLAK